MNIGITGTRFSITDHQRFMLETYLSTFQGICEAAKFQPVLHHGDCVGADTAVAEIARNLGYRLVCHPPVKDELRGFFASDEERPALPYLQRNRCIVEEVKILLVVPRSMAWEPRGGTWYTHDYAVKKKVDVRIFWPEISDAARLDFL